MKVELTNGKLFLDGKEIRGVEEYHLHKGHLCIILKIDELSEVSVDDAGELSIDAVVAGAQCGKQLYRMLKLAYEGVEPCRLKMRN